MIIEAFFSRVREKENQKKRTRSTLACRVSCVCAFFFQQGRARLFFVGEKMDSKNLYPHSLLGSSKRVMGASSQSPGVQGGEKKFERGGIKQNQERNTPMGSCGNNQPNNRTKLVGPRQDEQRIRSSSMFASSSGSLFVFCLLPNEQQQGENQKTCRGKKKERRTNHQELKRQNHSSEVKKMREGETSDYIPAAKCVKSSPPLAYSRIR